MCLVGEKLIKENVVVMYVMLDVNSEEKLLESVMMLCYVCCIVIIGIGVFGLVV